MQPPVVDYLKLRPGNLLSEQFRHLLYLLYWPVFGALFYFVEHLYDVPGYYPMYSPLDDLIPFCELFVIPYLFWFVYLVFQHVYGALYDIPNFKWLMRYIIITYSGALIVYFIFPNCQLLRPAEFARDNFLTRFMAGFYDFDTNTNVFPSIHVMGSLAVMSAGLQAKPFQKTGWRIFYIVWAVLICASTVFLKQHSILDFFGALPICLLAEWYCHYKHRKDAEKMKQKESCR